MAADFSLRRARVCEDLVKIGKVVIRLALTRGSEKEKERDKLIAAVSRAVYQAVVK